MHRERWTIVLFNLALAASSPAAAAQNWPARPVTMVVPFAAGSGVDVLGRILAPRLSEILRQPVIVENVGGAGGMVGTSRVAKAAPDGYQFVLGNVGTQAQSQALYRKPLYNAATDFAPVALIAEQPIVLIARKDFPAHDLRSFIDYARMHQAKLQYGSAGAGSASHLACVMLNSAAGIEVAHVPYRGGAEAMQDLIAGRIDYQCPFTAIALPQIESRFVQPIAMLSSARSPVLPDLGTPQEQGISGFDVGAWIGFFCPKGTPPAIVDALHDATVAAMETSTVQERLRSVGAELVAPDRRSPAYLQQFVHDEIRKWTVAITAAKIGLD
jgi:tripartite-type tricarboxylate transporter receptor subunit TctC